MSKKRQLDETSNGDNYSNAPSTKKQKLNEIRSLSMEPEDLDRDNNNDGIENIKHELTLDVGGIRFKTTLTTISKYPQSVLFKMFEGKFSLNPSEDGTYFIDRDGTNFKYILNYLRDGTLILPENNKNYVINQLISEANFYQLTSLHASLSEMLLFQKLQTKILKPMDVDKISKWIKEEYPNSDKPNWTFLPSQNKLYDKTDLLGTDSLLIVFLVHNHRFGFYLKNIYGEYPEINICPQSYDIDDDEYLSPEQQYNQYLEQQYEEYQQLYEENMAEQYEECQKALRGTAQYYWRDDVDDEDKEGFIFFLDKMNYMIANDKKYKCRFNEGITYKYDSKKGSFSISDKINVIFTVDDMEQEMLITNFAEVIGAREYSKDYLGFIQKQQKVKIMEVFRIT